jgi:hypothetical protein
LKCKHIDEAEDNDPMRAKKMFRVDLAGLVDLRDLQVKLDEEIEWGEMSVPRTPHWKNKAQRVTMRLMVR